MEEDDLDRYSGQPIEEPHEWQRLRRSMHRADSSWPISRPFVALKDNWKAVLIAAGLVVFFSPPEIIAAIRTITGVSQ